MKVLKNDIILAGAFAGFLGNIVKLLLAAILYYLELISKTYIHIAGKYFQHSNLDNIYAVVNSVLSDFFFASSLGVVFYIILRNTNMNYAKIKGLLFGGFVHIINNGVLIFGDFNRITLDESTQLLLLLPTIVFGLVTCWSLEVLDKT